jgi:hypothetical protein
MTIPAALVLSGGTNKLKIIPSGKFRSSIAKRWTQRFGQPYKPQAAYCEDPPDIP